MRERILNGLKERVEVEREHLRWLEKMKANKILINKTKKVLKYYVDKCKIFKL